MVSLEQLLAILPNAKSLRASLFHAPLNAAMQEFSINTPARQAAFLAQIGHETGQLVFVKELWGPTPQQLRYEPPGKLADDLGNKFPGDGAKFKGRGLIQITGRANYTAVMMALDIDCLEHPELLEQPTNACRTAGWFWKTKGLNELADAGDFLRITKRINGGTNGLKDREHLHAIAKRVLGVK